MYLCMSLFLFPSLSVHTAVDTADGDGACCAGGRGGHIRLQVPYRGQKTQVLLWCAEMQRIHELNRELRTYYLDI